MGRQTVGVPSHDGSVGEPTVYDLIGSSGQDAENPGKVNNGGPFADFVHVEDSGEQTLARASDICKRVGGTGGPEAVLDLVGGEIERFRLDNLHGLNFLLHQTLGGGGTQSLMIDPQGKTLSQALLQMKVKVPVSMIPKGSSSKQQ